MTEEEQLNGVSMDELPKSSIALMKAKDAQIPVSVAGEGSYNVPVRDVLTTAELAATAVTDTALIAHRAESDPHPQYVLGTEIGQTVAPLVSGAIPSQYLPGSYNEVQYFDDMADLPVTGSDDVIYVTRNDGLIYRWGGEGYHRLNGALALGETPETAYRGDRGKTAYDHALSQGNPHGTTATDLGLGTVLPRLDALYHGQAPIQSAWRPFPMQQNDFKALELFSFARSAEDQETIEFSLDIWTNPPPSGSLTYNFLYPTRCLLIRTGGDSPGGSGYSQWKPVSNGAPIWQDNPALRVEIYTTATHCHVYLVHHGAWGFSNTIIRITDLSIAGSSTVELSTAPIQDLTDLYPIYGYAAVTIWMTSDKGIFSTLEDQAAADEELNTYTVSLHSLLQQVRNSLKWVRGLLRSHGARHTYGGTDQISVDSRQITNMTSFARTLVDDATAAEARATLGAAAESVTLSDSAASTTPPTAGTSTSTVTLLQQIRNNLVGILGKFISKTDTAVQYMLSTLWITGGGFISERSTANIAFGARVSGNTGLNFIVTVDGEIRASDGTNVYDTSLMRTAAGVWSTPNNYKALSFDKYGGTDHTPLTGNVQTLLNGKVNRGSDAFLYNGTVGNWGKVFEITGMSAAYNSGVFAITWSIYNGRYYQGELQIIVAGSDASPSIYLLQIGPISTVLFTAVRNGTTWEIWAKQIDFSYNITVFNIKFAAVSNITGFSTTPTAASVSGTQATVYRYLSQVQSDSASGLVPAGPTQITSSQTVTPTNGQCFAINSTTAVNLIFSNLSPLNTITYVYSTRPTYQNDAPHTLTAPNPTGGTQTWLAGIGGYSQSAAQSGLMCIKMTSGWMVIGGMGNA